MTHKTHFQTLIDHELARLETIVSSNEAAVLYPSPLRRYAHGSTYRTMKKSGYADRLLSFVWKARFLLL